MRTPSGRLLLGVLAFAIFGSPLHAQTIHKCRASDGKIEYSQSPCGLTAQPTGTLRTPSGPTLDDHLAAQERRYRQQEYFRQKDAAERAEALERERLSIERHRVEQGDRVLKQSENNDKWMKETVQRHTKQGWEYRSRAEWIEYDKAQAQVRAAEAARGPTTCHINGKFANCF